MLKFIIAISLLSSSAFAVITSKCPETLEIEIPEVEVFSESFVQNQIKYHYNKVDFKSINNFLEGNFGQFVFKGELTDTTNSKCVYKSSDLFNMFRYVRIAGTDKKAYLVMEFEDMATQTSLSLFVSPSSKKPIYDFSGATAQIKAEAWGESWGDSYVVNISLGKGLIK